MTSPFNERNTLLHALVITGDRDTLPLEELANAPLDCKIAQYTRSLLIIFKKPHSPARFKSAFDLILASAEQGHAAAQHSLSHFYHFGLGTDVNPRSSFYWMLMAAREGHALAMQSLAKMYQHGINTDIDDQKALGWMIKAAKTNCQFSQFILAHWYHQGLCTTPDAALSLYWLNRSANQGYDRAIDMRNRVIAAGARIKQL